MSLGKEWVMGIHGLGCFPPCSDVGVLAHVFGFCVVKWLFFESRIFSLGTVLKVIKNAYAV
jgi:hypothetical protein